MRKKVNIYICSKPLQYFNLTNIEKTFDYPNILLIENNFSNAEFYYKNILKYDKTWDEIFFVSNGWFGLIFYLLKFKIENLFYYLDCYLVPSMVFNFLSFRKLYIYEEGLGTYLPLMHHQSNFTKLVKSFFSVPVKPGLHRKTNGVYVYAPNFFLKLNQNYLNSKSVNSFNKSFIELLNENSHLNEILFAQELDFINNIKNKKIGFLISSWEINYDFLKTVNFHNYDFFYIKLHPHNNGLNEKLNNFKKVSILNSPVLAEFILNKFLESKNEVDVFHHDSSSVIYFSQIPGKFNVYNIGEDDNIIKDSIEEIRNEFIIQNLS